MKLFLTLSLICIMNFGFSQVRIIYRTVFNEEGKELVNTEFVLDISVDKGTGITTYSFLKHVKESEFLSKFTVVIDEGRAIFNNGHIGMLYQGVDQGQNYYFIYQMDNYCIIKYLPEGKTSPSDSITWFTLMDGE